MQLAAAQTRYRLLHEEFPYHDGTRENWRKDPSPAFPYHWSDGVSIVLTPVDYGLGGDFLEQGS